MFTDTDTNTNTVYFNSNNIDTDTPKNTDIYRYRYRSPISSSQHFFYCTKKHFLKTKPEVLQKLCYFRNFSPITTNKVSSENSSLQLLLATQNTWRIRMKQSVQVLVSHWLRMLKAFECALKKFCGKAFLCNYVETLLNDYYFIKYSPDLNKQGLEWKLITSASYFEKKKIPKLCASYIYRLHFISGVECHLGRWILWS